MQRIGRAVAEGTRERLVEAAGRLFAQHGYDGVSVRDIVRAARANLAAVAYHFDGKAGLFREVMGRKIEAMRREIEDALPRRDRSPEERVREMLRLFAYRVMHADPDLKGFFVEMLAGGDRLPRQAIEALASRNALFQSAVRDGIRDGVFRHCDVDSAAWIFFGMLSAYDLCQPLVRGGSPRRGAAYPLPYVRRVVRSALDLFLNGLLRRPAARGRARAHPRRRRPAAAARSVRRAV
jgi:AcrR family transcriptional regulator